VYPNSEIRIELYKKMLKLEFSMPVNNNAYNVVLIKMIFIVKHFICVS
jgi:hypothetical protein